MRGARHPGHATGQVLLHDGAHGRRRFERTAARPPTKAATQASSAPLKTAGAVPPAAPARAARAGRPGRRRRRAGRSPTRWPSSSRSPAPPRRPGPARPGPGRSGCACRAGSPAPSCEPSTNSTIEWTTDCGWTTTSMRSNGTSKSRCASITSRPLFIRVAELIVTSGPMSQVGCASACSTVTSASCSARPAAERPAAGGQHQPAHLVAHGRRAGTGRAPSARSRPARSGPGRASAFTSGPPMISDSLLASASTRPASRAARVGPRPAAPARPFSTTSQCGRRASSALASGPADHGGHRADGVIAAASARGRPPERRSATATTSTANSMACWAAGRGRGRSRRARRSRKRPGLRRTMSSAWVPMEPVLPSTTTRREPVMPASDR